MERKSWPGRAMMQSTRPASIRFLRISPSPDWFEDMEPLARTKPADATWREVVEEVLHPGEVGVAHGRGAVLPSPVVAEPVAAPVGDVEGRIGEDVVGPQVGVAVVVEAVAVLDPALDAADRKVHSRHAPGGVVGLLAVDGDVALGFARVSIAGSVGADELNRLDEHAGGTAAGVVHAAMVWLQHLHEEADDGARSVELAALSAFGQGELLQEVLINIADHVGGAGLGPADLDVAHQVDDLSQDGSCPGRGGRSPWAARP